MAKKTIPQFLLLPIDEIELLDDNPREISDKEFKELCNDIKKDPHFLMQRPPLVNFLTKEKRKIAYAGNQRIKAAKQIGLKQLHVWVENDVPKQLQSERMLKDNLHRGEWNIDLFGGSGSTMISCEQLKRKARLVEQDPVFCDVIIKRWERLTGKKAKLIHV
jgi:hypothetical protein